MAEFRRAASEPINAFLVDGTFHCKTYFDDGEVFAEMKKYYNGAKYRFEIPEVAFDRVNAFLNDHGYALVPVSQFETFVVGKKQYTDHPDVLFQDSVLQRSAGGFNLFVMKDQTAVEQAVTSGAVPLANLDVSAPW